jgi:hypothetical protein
MEQLSINSQWNSCIRYCVQHSKQGIVEELPCGVTVCWSQCSLAFANGFFFSSGVVDEADLRRRLEGIKAYVKNARPTFPWMLFIEPELLAADLRDRSKQICSAASFDFIDNTQCMQLATRLLPPLRPLPAVDIKVAATQQDVYDAILLNTNAYNMDASAAESLVENRAFLSNLDKELCCVVSVDSKPVATATTLLLDECLYVALVATSAQHRKVFFQLIFSADYMD